MTPGRTLAVAALAAGPGLGTSLPAQDVFPPPDERLRIRAERAGASLRIDGVLDEPDWARASPASGFLQVEPDQGSAATRDTEVRLLFDAEHLYVGAVCRDEDARGGLRVPDLRRDFDFFANDLFGVVFDPFEDRRNAIAFQVNPLGAQRDLLVFDDDLYDRNWDAVWEVRTQFENGGWTAEMAIPWKTLRYPAGSATWGVNFVRIVRRTNEQSGWSPWPRSYTAYRMSYAGVLEGLSPPPPSRNVRVTPYAAARARRREMAATQGALDAGGDLKWAITPSSVLDATVNTDFAEADVDRQVVNLSRFSVFFPEKRPFFLESASLFNVGSEVFLAPFFSRRIGLSGDGRPLPIDAGLRFTSRTPSRSAGGLLMRSAESGGEPASLFGVGRFQRNVARASRVGGLVAARRDSGAGMERTNLVGALDTYFRLGETVFGQAMLSASSTSGPGGDGSAGYFYVGRRTNGGYVGWIQSYIGREYRAETGFVARPDVILTSPAFDVETRPAWKPSFVRALRFGATSYFYNRASDREFQEGYVRIEPVQVDFQDGGLLQAWLEPNWQRLEEPFEILPGVEAPAGRFRYDRYGVSYRADSSARLQLSGTLVGGGFYDGRLVTTTLAARFAPSPRASFGVSWERNEIEGVGDSARTVTHLVAPELRLALDPRLQLTAFVQVNTAIDRTSWNARFSWEFRPLSFVYLVYDDIAPRGSGAGPRDRQLVFKVAWLRPL